MRKSVRSVATLDDPVAELDELAGMLVGRLDLIMRRLVFAQPDGGPVATFSRHEIAVVDTLGSEGPATMGGLATSVRLPLSTATRVVDRLVARGFVERERPEDNRRVVRVRLAGAGRRFYVAARAARARGARAMLERLSVTERRELLRLFGKIAASVEGAPES